MAQNALSTMARHATQALQFCQRSVSRVMRIETEAIVVGVRAHGEHGAVVRALTAAHGLLAGYVRGGRSRRLRPVLVAGNIVVAEFRARTEVQLAALTVELVHGRAGMLNEPLGAAAIEWTTALVATTLPEGQPYPRVHAALDGVLTAIETASTAREWAEALVRYEVVVLAELGYGTKDVAPDSVIGRLAENGRRLAQDLLVDRRAAPLAARERLVDRLSRAVA